MPADRTSPCLSDEQLEHVAAGAAPEADVRRHMEQCAACRAAVREIRENNAFLASFVGRGRNLLRPREPASLAPDAIPGYRILCELHRGGQGVVYKALQESTLREVAIKVIGEGPFAGSCGHVRFEREVQILGQLDHPNIVTIHDSGLAAGIRYLVMNYIAGQPLDVYVRTAGREGSEARRGLSVRSILGLFAEICDAVNAAHLRGITHRDLKPSNIRVDVNGKPHILDFGLAKLDVAGVGPEAASQANTLTGQFLGSLPWASPEQVEGHPGKIDVRTDVYSLGVNLYHALTGRFPYEVAGNLRDVLDNILKAEPVRPSAIRPRIDEEVETIVLKCLQKEPQRRYQSAGELARDLRHYLAGDPIDAKRDSTWYVLRKMMRRHRIPLAVAAGFVVLSVAYGATMSLLYGLAAVRGEEARQAAGRLADELDASRIERARLLASSRAAPLSHDVIWSTHLSRQPGRPPQRTSPDPIERKAYWALWELYQSHPIRARALAPGSCHGVHVGESVLYATVSADGTLRVVQLSLELDAAATVFTLERAAGPDEEQCLAFSPDGRRLAWARSGHHRVFDLSSGETLFDRTFDSAPAALAFAGPGRLIRMPRDGKRAIEIWDIESGSLAGVLSGVPANQLPLRLVAVSADGSRIVAGTDKAGAALFVWEPNDAVPRAALTLDIELLPLRVPELTGLCISPDGERVATVFGCAVDLWSAAELRHLGRLLGGTSRHASCLFSPSGRSLAVLGRDRLIQLWDVERRRLWGVYAGHSAGIDDIDSVLAGFSRDEKLLISADGGGTVLAWDLRAERGQRRLEVPGFSTHSVRFSPDGRRLVSAGLDLPFPLRPQVARIHLWDAASGQQLGELLGHEGIVSDAAFTRDGRLLASCSHDGTLRLWDLEAGREIHRMQAPDRLSQLAFSPNEELVAAACDDGAVHIWGVSEGEHRATLQHSERKANRHLHRLPCLAFSPDGRLLASVSADATVRIWDLRTSLGRSLRGHKGTIRAVAFSPDGRQVATGGDDWTTRIWDAHTGEPLFVLREHGQPVFALRFSPDGLMLAVGGVDGSVTLWDPHVGRQLLAFDTHDAMVMSVDFSPKGERLAAAFADGVVRVWELGHYDSYMTGNFPR